MLAALLVSTKAVVKVVLICLAGAYLCRAGILTAQLRKGISEVLIKCLLPCLLFTRILPTMSLEVMSSFAWLAFANIVYVSVGTLIGTISVPLSNPPEGLRKVMRIVPAIGHSNSIPFLLVTLIAEENVDRFGAQGGERGVGFVGLYLVMHSITTWAVGMNVVRKPKEPETQAEDEGKPDKDSITDDVGGAKTPGATNKKGNRPDADVHMADLEEGNASPVAVHVFGREGRGGSEVAMPSEDSSSEAVVLSDHSTRSTAPSSPWVGSPMSKLRLAEEGVSVPSSDSPNEAESDKIDDLDTEEKQIELAWSKSVHDLDGTGECSPVTTRKPGKLAKAQSMYGKMMARVPEWVNRPMVVAILSAVLGLIPGIQALVSDADAPLNVLFSALAHLGDCGPTVGLLNVGALFVVDGMPKVSLVGVRPMIAMMVGRLLLVPACTLPLWMFARKYVPFFPNDPVLMLVICLQACTPSAYNLCHICILQGTGAKEIAAGLFFQNLVAVFSLTLWATVLTTCVV